MENSFFEYRDKTDAGSGSDSEVIDSSMVGDVSFTPGLKTPGKNRTVFVAESEESYSDDDSDNEKPGPKSKMLLRKSIMAESHVVSSSDDDSTNRSSIKNSQLEESLDKVVLTSSDEDECSPEMLPKRRPPLKPKSPPSDSSFIGRKKNNKRIMRLDSDTENSIVLEHDRHKKQQCLKDTPLRIEGGTDMRRKLLNQSIADQSDDETETKDADRTENMDDSNITNDNSDATYTDNEEDQSNKNYKNINKISSDLEETEDKADRSNVQEENDESGGESDASGDESDADVGGSNAVGVVNDAVDDEDNAVEQSDDDGPDEDEMVMSRATRMSIMGVIPKDADSDESDFILSDDNTRSSSANSLNDLPDVTINKKTPKKTDADSSRISCSPFASPLHDITNEIDNIEDSYESRRKDNNLKNKIMSNLTKAMNNKKVDDVRDDVVIINDAANEMRPPVLDLTNRGSMVFSVKSQPANKENVIDDDVTIIESKQEIIALSSDDEDEPKPEKKSPTLKKSPSKKHLDHQQAETSRKHDGTLKSFLAPSHPGQVMYVKKHVRENELAKLQGLKEDLQNIKYLLENMELESLPDGGVKLIERLTSLEKTVREQGDKVANMIVEPDVPTAQDMANDGFEGVNSKGLSWDELQKASNAVMPRMDGQRALATHMAERHLILDRLRDLHESLASRPPESQLGAPPPQLKTTLMQHQLHALAWLRWRETQRPCGGILADDMGLGKTITMISLVIGDRDAKVDDSDDDDDARGNSKMPRGGTLVVCPASLLQQWGGEVGKHCSAHAASVCLHHGPQRATHPHRLATYDLVVTTYNILQRDNEKNGVLMKVLWHRIILDEAHIVRNHKSHTSTAVSALKGRRRWCLTGTPVQNKDLDLFALLKFLRCTPFDELTMWKKWIDNKSVGGQERLSTIMRCILLRRTKAQLQGRGQLACLPDRTHTVMEVTLAKDEMNVYQKVLVFSKTLFGQFLHQRAEKQAGGALQNTQGAYDAMHRKMIALQGAKPVKSHEILVLLLRLRQVCCHCGLIAAMLDEDTAQEDQDQGGQDLLAELNKLSLEDGGRKNDQEEEQEGGGPEEGTTVTEAIRSVLSPNNPVFSLERQSSKITAVMDCLKENVFGNKGDKAVVVSQWTSVLRLVERSLASLRVRSVTLSGAVTVSQRQPLIDQLNDPHSDVKVMLLSLCAGGVGLNLCGANHLLLLDPHWNPQLEEQAQDRIYRVGQNKPVHIYRFMCVDTVEQSIRKLQQAKLELAENVLTGAKNTNNSKLTIEDLKVLFNMGQ